MFSKSLSILTWLINIFNPPPLEAMTKWQKLGRSLLVTLTLVVGCILCAMLGALGIFLVERGRQMFTDASELFADLGIVLISVGVNVLRVGAAANQAGRQHDDAGGTGDSDEVVKRTPEPMVAPGHG